MLILFCKPSYRKQWVGYLYKKGESDFCLTPNDKFFRYIMARTGFDEIMMSALYQTNTQLDFYSASSLKNSLQIDMSFHSDTFL